MILVAHFLQSVTPRLVLGGEMVYHRRPGEEGAILTLAGKYTGMGAAGHGDTTLSPGMSPRPSICFFSSSFQLGGDAQCRLWWCPCELLPQSQRAGEHRGPLCAVQQWGAGMVGLEEVLRAGEVWGHSVVGLEGVSKTTEVWGHGVVGLEGISKTI